MKHFIDKRFTALRRTDRKPTGFFTCTAMTIIISWAAISGCMPSSPKSFGNGNDTISLSEMLADTITQITSGYDGEIGMAAIINGTDTVTVNNSSIYPMMSVFKVHQALVVCHDLDIRGISLDSMMTVERDRLDPNTWSPMMKEHPEAVIALPIRELLRYTLIRSDNNASNLMFDRLAGTAQTDSFIATIIPRQSFRIAHTESEMAKDHDKAYSNYTSPLGAAMLMERLFTDSLVSKEKQHFITAALGECSTGKDRIAAPLLGREGIGIAHKTGSGYTNEDGVLAAHNDVAYISLPNGTCYTLAVFVKDFHGKEPQAAQAIARISATVYSLLEQTVD